MGFSEQLKELRKQMNLKQCDVAKALNMTQQNISLYESGNSTPNIESLIQFADFFNVSVDFLIDYKKNPNSFGLSNDAIKLLEIYDTLPQDKKNISLELLRVLKNTSETEV